MADASNTGSTFLKIAIWILRAIVSLLFVAAAAMKLTSQPPMVAEFQTVGLGQWFRYLTGALELAGGLAVLVPRLSILGAAILLLVDIGAFFAQIAILHMDWIHTVVIGALIGLLIYLQRRIGR
jgi:putative oxidoreductase